MKQKKLHPADELFGRALKSAWDNSKNVFEQSVLWQVRQETIKTWCARYGLRVAPPLKYNRPNRKVHLQGKRGFSVYLPVFGAEHLKVKKGDDVTWLIENGELVLRKR